MTPRQIHIEMEGYNIRKERELNEQNFYAYMQGQYFLEALAVIASSFGKGKRHEYPKKPYELKQSDVVELTEEEKIRRTKALFATLNTMKTNFENNHEKRKNDME